jgi:cell division protease FtsH
MSERLGPVALGHKEELVFLGREIGEQKNYSEKVAEAIDEEIRRLIDAGYATAVRILTEKRDILDTLAGELVKHETLEGEMLETIFLGLPPIEPPAQTPAAPPSDTDEPQAVPRTPPQPQPRLLPGTAAGS